MRGRKVIISDVESEAIDAVCLSSSYIGLPVVDSESSGEADNMVGDDNLRDVGASDLGRGSLDKGGRGEDAGSIERNAEEHSVVAWCVFVVKNVRS